jgi:hypothetical protein
MQREIVEVDILSSRELQVASGPLWLHPTFVFVPGTVGFLFAQSGVNE